MHTVDLALLLQINRLLVELLPPSMLKDYYATLTTSNLLFFRHNETSRDHQRTIQEALNIITI